MIRPCVGHFQTRSLLFTEAVWETSVSTGFTSLSWLSALMIFLGGGFALWTGTFWDALCETLLLPFSLSFWPALILKLWSILLTRANSEMISPVPLYYQVHWNDHWPGHIPKSTLPISEASRLSEWIMIWSLFYSVGYTQFIGSLTDLFRSKAQLLHPISIKQ